MLDSTAVAALVIALSVLAVAAAAWHVWYAAGFARVLAAHELPTWRAWVPVLNEAELFRLGRLEPVKAVLFLVPFVSVYALVLKVIAAHRVGASYGRGAGTTVLAVLLPPVWSGVLASERLVTASTDDDEDEPIVLAPAAAPSVIAPAAVDAPPAPAPGPIAAPPGPGTISPSVFAPAPAPATPIAAPPSVAPASGAPVAEVPGAAPPAASVPAVAQPLAPAAPPIAQPVAPAAPQRVPAAPASDVPGPRRTRRTGDAPAAVSSELEERTQLSRGPRAWELVLPTGQVVPVTARAIVLGRKPDGADDGAQYVTVADDTRTVSKQHARLAWSGEGWTLTDLGSTNGVALLAADGSERRLAAGASAPANGGFLLGDARLVLRLSTR